jgi:hypothetical protein
MAEWTRAELLFKKEGLIKKANVLVVGLGGRIFAAEFWLGQEGHDNC